MPSENKLSWQPREREAEVFLKKTRCSVTMHHKIFQQ